VGQRDASPCIFTSPVTDRYPTTYGGMEERYRSNMNLKIEQQGKGKFKGITVL
jgi:hypothetical protein